jgi:hypothetical protein
MLPSSFRSKLSACADSLFSGLDAIAIATSLIERTSRRFSAKGFVLAVMNATLNGKGSFNDLAEALSVTEPESLSSQAMSKRIDTCAVAFMLEVVTAAAAARWNREDLIEVRDFNRVIMEDSSQIALPAANHPDFPGHGNGTSKTSGCKFDYAFDLVHEDVVHCELHLATTQDREIGKSVVDKLRANDLLIRDMGYFSLGEFALIEQRGAFWLSRLPLNVSARDAAGRPLEELLRKAKGEVVEFEALVGNVGHKARLVAVRADRKTAEKRRRERREEARKHGKTPDQAALLRDGWHLMITNIGAGRMSIAGLFKLYGVRWQIEIVFRAWKQSSNHRAAFARRSNSNHLQVLMLASMLRLILTQKVASLLRACHPDRWLSIEKIARHFASHLTGVKKLESFGDYEPDPRHIQIGRRKGRKSLVESTFSILG